MYQIIHKYSTGRGRRLE